MGLPLPLVILIGMFSLQGVLIPGRKLMKHVKRGALRGIILQGRQVTSMVVLILHGLPSLRKWITHLCHLPAIGVVQLPMILPVWFLTGEEHSFSRTSRLVSRQSCSPFTGNRDSPFECLRLLGCLWFSLGFLHLLITDNPLYPWLWPKVRRMQQSCSRTNTR